MKKFIALTLSLMLGATIATALPDGTYKFSGDGSRGEARIENGEFEMGFGGQGCVGGVDGSLQPSGGTWIVLAPTSGTSMCQITISPYENGYYIDGSPECSYFSGAMCSMDGTLKPIGATKAAASTPRSDTAVLAASFKNQSLDFRKRMQSTLAKQGHYKGSIDGIYGPGTEAAVTSPLPEGRGFVPNQIAGCAGSE